MRCCPWWECADSHVHSEHQPIPGCQPVNRRSIYEFKWEVRAILGRSCFAQTCRYVQGFKMLGGDMADLGPESLLGCELRHEGQGQVGVEKDICLGVPVALSKVSIFLWNFLQRFRHSSNPIMKNLAPESWNIPAIPSRAWGGSVRRSWQLTTRSLLFPWFFFLFSWLLFFFSSPFFSWLLSSLLLSWELFLFLCPFSGLVFLIFSSICNREFRPLHFDYTYKPMGFEGFKCLPQ